MVSWRTMLSLTRAATCAGVMPAARDWAMSSSMIWMRGMPSAPTEAVTPPETRTVPAPRDRRAAMAGASVAISAMTCAVTWAACCCCSGVTATRGMLAVSATSSGAAAGAGAKEGDLPPRAPHPLRSTTGPAAPHRTHAPLIRGCRSPQGAAAERATILRLRKCGALLESLAGRSSALPSPLLLLRERLLPQTIRISRA